MAKIRVITGGCGIEYKDAHGNARHALKTPESGAFECDDAQAERLVALKVAVYVEAKATAPADQNDEQETQPEASQETEKATGHLDAAQLETMTNAQLKALGEELGADVSGCKKKADYIAAIIAVEVEVDEDDDNDMPELSVADPE